MEYKRLTTDNPDGNFETLMNYCYGKDRIAMLRYAGGKEDIPLHEYVAKLCKEKGCIEDDNLSLQEIEEMVCDPWGDCCDCAVGALYYLGCQAVQTRGVLKRYEDSGLSPKEAQELAKAKAEGRAMVLPCRVGDTVWAKEHTSYSIDGVKDFIQECKVTKIVVSEKRIVFCVSNYGMKGSKGNIYAASFTLSSFGKTVFLTKEEAGKALGSDTP